MQVHYSVDKSLSESGTKSDWLLINLHKKLKKNTKNKPKLNQHLEVNT